MHPSYIPEYPGSKFSIELAHADPGTKYECVYLHDFEAGSEARASIGWWIDFYNAERPHSSLDDRTPDEAHSDSAAGTSLGHDSHGRSPGRRSGSRICRRGLG